MSNHCLIAEERSLRFEAERQRDESLEALEYVRTSYRMDVMRLRELGRSTLQADEAISRIDAALENRPATLADATKKDPGTEQREAGRG